MISCFVQRVGQVTVSMSPLLPSPPAVVGVEGQGRLLQMQQPKPLCKLILAGEQLRTGSKGKVPKAR